MGQRYPLVMVLLAACGFQGSGDSLDKPPPGTGSDDPAPIDAHEDPVTCGSLTCDPHAECNTASPGCTCAMGYDGDGFSCHDINECDTPNYCSAHGGEMTCLNTPGSVECFTPKGCDDIHAKNLPDADYTLYVGRDHAKPWTAHCKGDHTYLPLPKGGNENYGQYTAGGSSNGTDVKTKYSMVRIDPDSLIVDINDREYADSNGTLLHSGGIPVVSMPYAIAMDCAMIQQQATPKGKANIDLRGTPFKVSASFDKRGSAETDGAAVKSDGDQVVKITGGGHCGWYGPTPVPYNPFNDFSAANNPSKILQLVYVN